MITDGTISSGSKQIALTFDSGWEYKETIPLLNVLDQYGVKATFFPRYNSGDTVLQLLLDAPPPYPSGQVTYSVKSGDTLYRIARLYGISAQQIIDANNLWVGFMLAPFS